MNLPPPGSEERDTAWLDRQYNARASVDDAELFLARRRAWSAEARARFAFTADVAYGSHPRERLDIFSPSIAGAAPLAVYLHGGYWHSNVKEDSSFVAASLVPNGIAVAVVDYPLLPDATMDSLVSSARRAVAWLHREADGLGLDARRMIVVGHSSGAHLGAMVAASGWQDQLGLPADVIKGACLISGLYDLEPVRRTYVNAWARLTPDSAGRNSPLRHLPGEATRAAIVYGELETDEFRRQSVDYAAACARHGMTTQVVELERTNHFETPEGLGRPDSFLARVVADMIGTAGS